MLDIHISQPTKKDHPLLLGYYTVASSYYIVVMRLLLVATLLPRKIIPLRIRRGAKLLQDLPILDHVHDSWAASERWHLAGGTSVTVKELLAFLDTLPPLCPCK